MLFLLADMRPFVAVVVFFSFDWSIYSYVVVGTFSIVTKSHRALRRSFWGGCDGIANEMDIVESSAHSCVRLS